MEKPYLGKKLFSSESHLPPQKSIRMPYPRPKNRQDSISKPKIPLYLKNVVFKSELSQADLISKNISLVVDGKWCPPWTTNPEPDLQRSTIQVSYTGRAQPADLLFKNFNRFGHVKNVIFGGPQHNLEGHGGNKRINIALVTFKGDRDAQKVLRMESLHYRGTVFEIKPFIAQNIRQKLKNNNFQGKRPKPSFPSYQAPTCGVDGFCCKTCAEYDKKLNKKPYFGYSENIAAIKAACCQARVLLTKKNHLCLTKLKFNLHISSIQLHTFIGQ